MRIRSIKPAFWRSPTIARLPRDVRLFFIGLWNYVDDDGRGLAEPRLIKGDLFSLDDSVTPPVIIEWLRALDEASLILRYKDARGRELFAVRSWKEHQRPDRPKASELQAPPDVRLIVDEFATNPRRLVEASPLEVEVEGEVERVMGDGGGVEAQRDAAPNPKARRQLDPTSQQAYDSLRRASPNPTAFDGELDMITQGAYGKAPSPAQLGQALRDLQLNGEPVKGSLLRAYVSRAMAESGTEGLPVLDRKRFTGGGTDWDALKAKLKAEDDAEAAAKAKEATA